METVLEVEEGGFENNTHGAFVLSLANNASNAE
jgi:hypothetical protein